LSTSLIFVGLVFGSVGFGYLVYGWRQHAVVPLMCGLALMTVPYVVANIAVLAVVGIALVVAPYFVRF
jgi:hypothetical protein